MGKSTKKRKLSAFNIFMKTEIKKVKNANKNLSHMDAFKQAAKNWSKVGKSSHPTSTKSTKSSTKKARKTKGRKMRKGTKMRKTKGRKGGTQLPHETHPPTRE